MHTPGRRALFNARQPSAEPLDRSLKSELTALPLLQDERGTATLEYLVVLVTVTLALLAGLLALGPHLGPYFQLRVMWLSLPIP